MILNESILAQYVDRFNRDDDETIVQLVPNGMAREWMARNIPLFECPDDVIEEVYYFRWWVYRKHLKQTTDGIIVTEFHPTVPWAGKHNSINCAAGHHIYEGRWLRNASDFLPEYIRFWFRGGGSLRSYSAWLADAVLRYCDVRGDYALTVELLPDLIANHEAWEQSNRHASGLFWSNDDRDAMELSISGPGLRPTLNSYMYGDAQAIARIAERTGQTEVARRFAGKAHDLRRLVQERLWDADVQFFKVIPLATSDAPVPTWDWRQMDAAHNVREQIGYIPWYFALPEAGYEAAWRELVDEQGFAAPFGPTTAERRHPRFMYKHEHECLWNGPSWPFATSQTLTALANVLADCRQEVVTRDDYVNVLRHYAASHYRVREDGVRVPWLDENLDPFTGEWLSRSILRDWGWPDHKGGRERGKDYNHSTFCDLVISGLVGVRADGGSGLTIKPLTPDAWDYFCLEQLPYRGRLMTILYDKDGRRYGRGSGLRVFADGKEVGRSATLSPLVIAEVQEASESGTTSFGGALAQIGL
jgi:hypothetical protein